MKSKGLDSVDQQILSILIENARASLIEIAERVGLSRAAVKNRIAQLRKERRITQEELADAVEVTRQTIISLENGRYNASLLLAHKIAKYFGSSIEEIFLFEEEET